MHIQALVKGLEQGLVTTQVSHDAQFNLGIIGTGNQTASRCHKGFAHFAAFGRANRNVLQVGIVARQATRDSHRLRVMRMHPPCSRQSHLRQLVGVCPFQFGQTAVLQNACGQGVVFCQFFQHLFIGTACTRGGFFDDRQTQFVKKYFTKLFRAAQIERLTCNFISFSF